MTRIILFTLLTLTISCGNTRPGQTDTDQALPTPAAAQIAPTAEPDAATIGEPAEDRTSAPEHRPAYRPAAARTAPEPARETTAVVPAATVQPASPLSAALPAETPASETAEPARTEPVSEPEAAAAATTVTAQTQTAAPIQTFPTQDAAGGTSLLALRASDADSPLKKNKRFLPTRQRIDREINKLKFAYKGEVMMGLTASYGTMSSDDSDILLILDGIDADGTVATVKPFIGYFYRDNNCLGVRFGYRHMDGKLDAARYDFGESNDASGSIPKVDFNSDNYSFGLFHRSYAGLDPKGRFGLFAEFELSLSTGSSKLSYQPDTSSDRMKTTYSDNTQVKLAFNPGAAVYIFPNVCATISFGLGGIQYTSVTQKDGDGNKIGTREASNMRFRLNIAAINFGMTIHMWDKKKR